MNQWQRPRPEEWFAGKPPRLMDYTVSQPRPVPPSPQPQYVEAERICTMDPPSTLHVYQEMDGGAYAGLQLPSVVASETLLNRLRRQSLYPCVDGQVLTDAILDNGFDKAVTIHLGNLPKLHGKRPATEPVMLQPDKATGSVKVLTSEAVNTTKLNETFWLGALTLYELVNDGRDTYEELRNRAATSASRSFTKRCIFGTLALAGDAGMAAVEHAHHAFDMKTAYAFGAILVGGGIWARRSYRRQGQLELMDPKHFLIEQQQDKAVEFARQYPVLRYEPIA